MPSVTAIREDYKNYLPPWWVRPTVERLLESVPTDQLGGLQVVVLTNAATVGKGKTHRVGGRKYKRSACRGFYHALGSDGPAWIEVIVDNTVRVLPPGVTSLNVLRDYFIGDVLYHEIGHHLEATIGSPKRSGELAAEAWKERLFRIHFRRRYWWLRPIAIVIGPMVTRLRRRMTN